MNKRISLLVVLMVGCTLALTGLQAYWTRQAYRQATRTFRRGAGEALAEAVRREGALRQLLLRQHYQHWLADTSAVLIRSRINSADGDTYFLLSDRRPYRRERRAPFQLGFQGYHKPLHSSDSTGRAFFIRRFLAGPLTRDLREGTTYFYTRRLGNQLDAALQADTIHRQYLAQQLASLLAQDELTAPFHLSFTPADHPARPAGLVTATRQVALPGQPAQLVQVQFMDPDRWYLTQLRGTILASLGLIGVVIGCFAYSLRTLLTQAHWAAIKEDFVRNLTHELKTPLATIGITAEALQSGELPPADQADYLAIIRQQAARLGLLIDRMLQRVVAEQAGSGPPHRPLDLAAVLAQAASQARPRFAEAGRGLHYEVPPDPLPVRGDVLHLTNVLDTLLDNALKYGPPAGQVWLRAERAAGMVRVHVINEGGPIPVQYQARLFEPFFRVPTGDRHEVPGYGLGLHYARTQLARHGGRVSVHSQGPHTTFTLHLPLTDGFAPPAATGR